MLGSSGVTNEEKPRSLSKHLFITRFSSEWGIHRSFQLVLLALTQLSCSQIKLQIQRQSFIQNILDPKPNFELLLISITAILLRLKLTKLKFIILLSSG